jgi:CHAD domain-containing protein
VTVPATKRPIEASLIRLDDGRLVLQLREGVRRLRQTYYHLDPLPSDFGRAFRLQKFASCGGDGRHYDVCLQDGADRCCCLGHEAHGRCRHVSSLRDLVGRAEL